MKNFVFFDHHLGNKKCWELTELKQDFPYSEIRGLPVYGVLVRNAKGEVKDHGYMINAESEREAKKIIEEIGKLK